jgi:hypothetical protein
MNQHSKLTLAATWLRKICKNEQAPARSLLHGRYTYDKVRQLVMVAHHMHLCFQARMSDESQLAPHPRL